MSVNFLNSSTLSSSSNPLDSILISSKGMDLEKGVPGKSFDSLLKVETPSKAKDAKEVKAKVINKAAPAKKHCEESAEVEEPVAKEGAKPKAEETQAAKPAKPAAENKPEPAKAENQSEDISNPNVVQSATPVEDMSIDPNLQVPEDGEVEVVESLLNGSKDLLASDSLDKASMNVNSLEANKKLEELNHEMKQIFADSKPIQLSKEKSEGANHVKMPEPEVSFSEEPIGSDKVPAFDLKTAEEAEAPAKSFKHLVDELFIQKNIQNNEVSSDIPVALQFAKEVEQKFDVSAKNAAAPIVRSNLVNDMQPLVSKVLATDKGGEMSLSLRPANLGMVKIDIAVDQGQVKVAVQTEQPHAKTLLQSQVSELKQQLHQAGLKVDEVKISQMQFEKAENASSQERDPQQQPARRDHSSENSSRRENENARSFESFDFEKLSEK